MSIHRRSFLLASVSSSLAVLGGCSQGRQEKSKARPPEQPLVERVTVARKRGADFLLSQQSKDGAWRSDTYGLLKDGTALTPLILNALLAAAPESKEAIRKGAVHLAAMTRADGSIVPPAHGFE